MTTTMIITWAMVIAGTLLLEFFTVDFFACCFSLGGIISLVLAICKVDVVWQLLAFFVVTIVAICATRPLVKKLLKKPTEPTNVDQNFGKTTRLLADVVDGVSSIKINDVVWTAVCDTKLKKDDTVTIERVEGNKMIVKAVTKEAAKPVAAAEQPAKKQKGKAKAE